MLVSSGITVEHVYNDGGGHPFPSVTFCPVVRDSFGGGGGGGGGGGASVPHHVSDEEDAFSLALEEADEMARGIFYDAYHHVNERSNPCF